MNKKKFFSVIMVIFVFCFCLCLPEANACIVNEQPVYKGAVNITSINIDLFSDEATAKALSNLGVGYVRLDCLWEDIEQEKGVYDFTQYDQCINLLLKKGISVLLILCYGNPLYDEGQAPCTDTGRNAFSAFAAAVVDHYLDENVIYEIWNEPNEGFWYPVPNVNDYVKLLQACIPAMKSVDEECIIAAPGAAEFPLEFLAAIGESGVFDDLAAVSVHPYRSQTPETAEKDYNKLKALIDRFSSFNTPVVASSEWGYSEIWVNMDAQEQAKYVVRMNLINIANQLGLSSYYNFTEYNPSHNPEHRYGLVKVDGTVKPGFKALSTMNCVLEGFDYLRREDMNNENDYLLVFSNGSETTLVLWTTEDEHVIEISSSHFASNTIYKTDMMGVESEINVTGDVVEIAISDSPVYLTYQDGGTFLWKPQFAANSLYSKTLNYIPIKGLNSGESINGIFNIYADYQLIGTKAVALSPQEEGTIQVPVYFVDAEDEEIGITIEFISDSLPRQTAKAAILVKDNLHMEITPLPVVNANENSLAIVMDNTFIKEIGETYYLEVFVGGLSLGKQQVIIEKDQSIIEVTVDDSLNLSQPISAYILDGQDNIVDKMEPVAVSRLDFQEHLPFKTSISDELGSISAEIIPVNSADAPQNGIEEAVKIDYYFSYYNHAAIVYTDKQIVEEPEYMGIWLYGDSSENGFNFTFEDSGQKLFSAPSEMTINWDGWKFIKRYVGFDTADDCYPENTNHGVVQYPIQKLGLLDIESYLGYGTESTVYIGAVYFFSDN